MGGKQIVSTALASALLCASLCGAAAQVTGPAKKAGVRLLTREVSLGREHPGELKGTRTLSPDRRHLAFVAKVAGGEAVYVDGGAGKTYPTIANDPLSEAGTGSPIVFSRDGSRAAYVADLSPPASRTPGQRRVVAGGVEGPLFDYVWSGAPKFSDDAKRLSYTARRGGKSLVVADGAEGREYDGFLTSDKYEREARLSVEGDRRLSILARRAVELLRVEMEIVEE